MQIVPNSEVTIGDTIEFKFNDDTYESIITNSPDDNSFRVCLRCPAEITFISLESVQEYKRIKEGPWHKLICGEGMDRPLSYEGKLTTNATDVVNIKDLK